MSARPTAYSYVRFSSPQQAEGNSFDRQTDRAAAWAKAKGVKLDDKLKLEDLGISAFKGANRRIGALGGFLRAVEEGKVKRGSYLLVESLDRLSREEPEEGIYFLLSLTRQGIVVVSLIDGVEYRGGEMDTMKMLQATMSFGRAHDESRTKSDRVDRAWKKKKEDARTKKKPLGKQTPGWIELADGGYRLIPEKAAIVREIFKLTIEGMGRSSIARRFNQDKKSFPPLRHGQAWHFSYIAKILANRACIGEYQPHVGHAGKDRKPVGDPVVGYYPAVVSESTFYRASAAVERRRGKQRGRVGERVNNLFTGLLFDARSGSTMVYMDTRFTSTAWKSRLLIP